MLSKSQLIEKFNASKTNYLHPNRSKLRDDKNTAKDIKKADLDIRKKVETKQDRKNRVKTLY